MDDRKLLGRSFGLLLVVLLLAACKGGQAEPTATLTPGTPTSTPAPPSATPGFVKKVDVGGYSLYIKCFGEGSPTVVLDSGWGGGVSDWNQVKWKIEPQTPTRVCAYNRAGIEGSDPAPKKPRTNQDMARDLHALLTNANITGPYVLVAHSMAGFTARLFASQYPQDVVGMVLVDTPPPGQHARRLALLPPETPDESQAVKDMRQELVAFGDDPMEMPEYWDVKTSDAQVRATGSLGSIPLVVLTQDVDVMERQMKDDGLPPELAERLAQEWLRIQQDLCELSSNSTHIIVEDSSHMIPQEDPEAVIDAIFRVIEAVRRE